MQLLLKRFSSTLSNHPPSSFSKSLHLLFICYLDDPLMHRYSRQLSFSQVALLHAKSHAFRLRLHMSREARVFCAVLL